ncbi:phosphoribosyl-dephospho-CoA transferase [Granulicella rosea]|uniref:Phosphoribosyl-dephospho-CoA transferase n=1 Tax=Granulicella rosea TaxID=474952 RepID=A0A239EHA0_9BACT|nr:malonate decarboxylase holo-ACP synthase [Granulicella rosea]SNS43272.1 phosphoribosyl-dephospho-CoA transferase [Granulicella rosea]
MSDAPRPHDLLHVCFAPAMFHFEHDASAAFMHLHRLPLVVVRRGNARSGRIPVGVRGHARSERYAGWMEPEAVVRIESPADLAPRNSGSALPVFKALDRLRTLWRGLAMPWGPTGSAGFELASRIATVTASSDLDLQIRADRWFSRAEARDLLSVTVNLHAAVDVVVETPFGGFALAEYAASATCMLRTNAGPVLTAHPWIDPRAENAA